MDGPSPIPATKADQRIDKTIFIVYTFFIIKINFNDE
jgi:hypothetical protein